MDFSTTIVLSPEENDRYQAVYASQRYGTFYGIYGKFKVEKLNGKILLHRIDLKLINYKGVLNMSMNKELEVDENAKELIRNLYVVLLKVKVQAKLDDSNDESHYIFEKPLPIHKGTFFSVVSELVPLCGTKGSEMEPEVCGVFDNEFYYRDGLSNEKRKVSEIPLEKGSPDGSYKGYKFDSQLLPKLDDRFGSIRCTVGNSKIII
ncbi:MAG: hypothetical protein JXR05_12130 [Flavobacteriaceae bacterium]